MEARRASGQGGAGKTVTVRVRVRVMVRVVVVVVSARVRYVPCGWVMVVGGEIGMLLLLLVSWWEKTRFLCSTSVGSSGSGRSGSHRDSASGNYRRSSEKRKAG